jgi:lysozyme
MTTNFKTSQNGIEIIKRYESLHDGDLSQIGLQPKKDPSGYWTEGYGHLMIYKGKPIKGDKNKELAYSISTIKTEEQAEKQLKIDIEEVEFEINKLNLDITQNQFDALISFTYNCGVYAFKSSTLLKMIQNKVWSDQNLIRDEFLKWKYSDSKELLGLYCRRKSEAKLFIENVLKFYN